MSGPTQEPQQKVDFLTNRGGREVPRGLFWAWLKQPSHLYEGGDGKRGRTVVPLKAEGRGAGQAEPSRCLLPKGFGVFSLENISWSLSQKLKRQLYILESLRSLPENKNKKTERKVFSPLVWFEVQSE